MEVEPPVSAAPKPKRRWFQFSLRTLMITVTLLAVPLGYVGWQAKIVRERKSYLQSNKHDIWAFAAGSAPATANANGSIPPFAIDVVYEVFAYGDKTQAPTGIRMLLGDEVQDEVWVSRTISSEKKQAVAALFPEADVNIWNSADQEQRP